MTHLKFHFRLILNNIIFSHKRANVRKKMFTLNVLPDGIETIGSSSSQDEADMEEIPAKFRKRKKILRKTRVKRQKGKRMDY